jgi:hypothetical protein
MCSSPADFVEAIMQYKIRPIEGGLATLFNVGSITGKELGGVRCRLIEAGVLMRIEWDKINATNNKKKLKLPSNGLLVWRTIVTSQL